MSRTPDYVVEEIDQERPTHKRRPRAPQRTICVYCNTVYIFEQNKPGVPDCDCNKFSDIERLCICIGRVSASFERLASLLETAAFKKEVP